MTKPTDDQWKVTGRMSITKTSYSEAAVTARFVVPAHPEMPWPRAQKFDVRAGVSHWVIYPTNRGDARWRRLHLDRAELILEKCVAAVGVSISPMVRGVSFTVEGSKIVAALPADDLSLMALLSPTEEEISELDEQAYRIEQLGWRRVWVEDQARFRWVKLPGDPDPAGSPGNLRRKTDHGQED